MKFKARHATMILLVAGVALLVLSEIGLSNVRFTVAGQSYDVWEYTCSLTNGKTYRLYIESHDNWATPFTTGAFTTEQPVNVTITSPEEGVTTLQAFFYGEKPTNPYQTANLAVIQVVYQHVDDASLRVDTSYYAQIQFTAKQGGNYTARVLREGLWSDDPPNFLLFYEVSSENQELYTATALAGGAMSIIGGIGLVVTMFRRESVKHRKTRK